MLGEGQHRSGEGGLEGCLDELQEEVAQKSDRVHDEFGDVLFSLINYARFLDVNPDDALESTNRKFIRRFQFMEDAIREDGADMTEMNLDQLDVYWEQSKKKD